MVPNLAFICFPSTPLGNGLTTNLRASLLSSLHIIRDTPGALVWGLDHPHWLAQKPARPPGLGRGTATDLRALWSVFSRMLKTYMVTSGFAVPLRPTVLTLGNHPWHLLRIPVTIWVPAPMCHTGHLPNLDVCSRGSLKIFPERLIFDHPREPQAMVSLSLTNTRFR